jgi:hypothetical protein
LTNWLVVIVFGFVEVTLIQAVGLVILRLLHRTLEGSGYPWG